MPKTRLWLTNKCFMPYETNTTALCNGCYLMDQMFPEQRRNIGSGFSTDLSLHQDATNMPRRLGVISETTILIPFYSDLVTLNALKVFSIQLYYDRKLIEICPLQSHLLHILLHFLHVLLLHWIHCRRDDGMCNWQINVFWTIFQNLIFDMELFGSILRYEYELAYDYR